MSSLLNYYDFTNILYCYVLAELRQWDLTLYGTATSPVYDLKQAGADGRSDIYKDVSDNSIDTSTSWRGGAEVSYFLRSLSKCSKRFFFYRIAKIL